MALSRRLARGLVIVLGAVVTASVVVWAAWAIDVPEPGRRRGWRSWESASPAECRLLAEALAASGEKGAQELPLMGESTRTTAPCDWSQWGFSLGRVSAARFAASARGDHRTVGYLPHLTLTAPKYSALRLRAAVEVGRSLGWDNGVAKVCYFRRGVGGWRLEGCLMSWRA